MLFRSVYLLAPALKTGLIVIHQLPKTPRTLWCRLLGKGRVQEQAIKEVAALPPNNSYRQNALDLLGNLKVILEARATIEPEEQELVMQLSPLYLEKIQAAELVGEARGKAEGEAGLVLRLLNRRVGVLSPQLLARIQQLTLPQLEDLGEALLDFTGLADLESWLNQDLT